MSHQDQLYIAIVFQRILTTGLLLQHPIFNHMGTSTLGINHSQHFVSEIDERIHTNTIERVWRSLKEKFKHNKPRVDIGKHIAEFMYEVWICREDRYQFTLTLIKQMQEEV